MRRALSRLVPDRSPVTARVVACITLLPALVLAWESAQLFRQDLAYTEVETEVSFWGRGEYHPDAPTRDSVGELLAGLLHQQPDHPGYLMLAASYYDWEAYWAETAEREYDYTQRAAAARNAARQSRPAHPGNSERPAE